MDVEMQRGKQIEGKTVHASHWCTFYMLFRTINCHLVVEYSQCDFNTGHVLYTFTCICSFPTSMVRPIIDIITATCRAQEMLVKWSTLVLGSSPGARHTSILTCNFHTCSVWCMELSSPLTYMYITAWGGCYGRMHNVWQQTHKEVQ